MKGNGTISKHTIQSMGDNQVTTQHQLILTWENYLAVGNLIWRGVYLKLEKFYLKFQCEHCYFNIIKKVMWLFLIGHTWSLAHLLQKPEAQGVLILQVHRNANRNWSYFLLTLSSTIIFWKMWLSSITTMLCKGLSCGIMCGMHGYQ